MANGKPHDQEIEDTDKRDDEMAEGKSPEVVTALYGKGGQYYCAECHSELPIHQSCPTCHMEIE